LDPTDFGSTHPATSNLVASAMTILSRNINRNEMEELVFNPDSEEQCTTNVSDIHHKQVMILLQQMKHRMTE
jgi:hypothetical protein